MGQCLKGEEGVPGAFVRGHSPKKSVAVGGSLEF
jgi:hypothetical protein